MPAIGVGPREVLARSHFKDGGMAEGTWHGVLYVLDTAP